MTRTTLAALIAFGAASGCEAVPAGKEPADVRVSYQPLPTRIAGEDSEIRTPPGENLLIRIPSTGDKRFEAVFGAYPQTAASEVSARVSAEEAPAPAKVAPAPDDEPGGAIAYQVVTATGTDLEQQALGPAGPPVALVLDDGWAYLIEYGWRPRAQGRRVTPVGNGTNIVLWVDELGVDRVFLIKSPISFDSVTIHAEHPVTGAALARPLSDWKKFARMGPAETDITLHDVEGGDGSKNGKEIKTFLAHVEATAKAAGQPWPRPSTGVAPPTFKPVPLSAGR